jgi:hypothetical protein
MQIKRCYNDINLRGSRSKKDKQITNDENKVRIQNESFNEHPSAKGIHEQKKPIKKNKVYKSHNAIQ